MPIRLRGAHYHYRFKLNGVSYAGPCDNCQTSNDAEKFESAKKQAIQAELSLVAEEEKKNCQNKTLVALIENYKQELTGAEPIPLSEAYELAVKKPSKREPSLHIAKQKRRYWYDFVSYMAAIYPEITTLDKVRKLHCEAYVRYLIDHGRFNQDVDFEALRNGKKIKARYKRTYELAGKTIHEIARAKWKRRYAELETKEREAERCEDWFRVESLGETMVHMEEHSGFRKCFSCKKRGCPAQFNGFVSLEPMNQNCKILKLRSIE